MGERESLSDHLSPTRHAAERKHETGEQDRRDKNEESHLHGLQLIFRDRGKRDAHRQVRDDEDEGYQQQKGNASVHGHVKEKMVADKHAYARNDAAKNESTGFSDEHSPRRGRYGD